MMDIPEISVQEVAEKRSRGDAFILLDVREETERNFAELGDDVLYAPLSDLADRQLEALPDAVRHNQEAEVVVFCHHGGRSAQVTGWLRQQGWANVHNMSGGIDAYALDIDPSIGRY